MPDPTDLHISGNSLDSIRFTEQEVFDTRLSNLNPNKASGIDNIAPIVLKNYAHALTLPIYHLFTTSIRSEIIPREWKSKDHFCVATSPVTNSVPNYSPISLLCIISKVLERLIYDKITDTVATSIISQYGFQRGSSTLQQLFVYFHQLIANL